MMDGEPIDPQAFASFLEESLESLEGADVLFLELEQRPNHPETVASLFRTYHSLKGNSAFFGLMKIKRLAHRLEDGLSRIREQPNACSSLMDPLIEAHDLIKEMVESLKGDTGELRPQDEPRFDHCLEGISQQLSSITETQGCDATAMLKRAEKLCEALEHDPKAAMAQAKELRRKLEEAVAAKAANAAPVHADPADPKELYRRIVSDLEVPLELNKSFDDERIERVFQRIISLHELLSPNTEASSQISSTIQTYQDVTFEEGFGEGLRKALIQELSGFSEKLGGPAPRKEAPRPTAAARTMRVAEDKIDQFLSFVGELIVVREMFKNLEKRILAQTADPEIKKDFQWAMTGFSNLSQSLQSSLMEIRKVSAKPLLSRAPKLVRDVAHETQKRIQVEVQGESLRVDKSIIESLKSPLTHLVRNAADHGIEPPEERAAAGKAAEGKVSVLASQTDENFVIRVVDDGKGIDADALKAKALKMGVLSAEAAQKLSYSDALQLIFHPGLSTKKKATDISGRGVGMDVVHQAITERNGTVEVKSKPGKGSQFTVRIPASMHIQIIDGFLVQVEGLRFILPVLSVKETFSLASRKLSTIIGSGECLHHRGRALPLARCAELLGLVSGRAPRKDGIVVTLRSSKVEPFGLVVDAVLGVHQVVIRTVEGLKTRHPIFSGGAVLGDGGIAMVLDLNRLSRVRHAHTPVPESISPSKPSL